MITVVARWEDSQMPAELEWRMWRQLKCFNIMRFIFTPVMPEMSGIDIEQYDTMQECLDAAGPDNRAFLEPSGYNTLHDLPQGDITLILGNTNHSNIEHAQVNETYKIMCPSPGHLYPTGAAAVALAFWYGQ